MMCCSTFKTKGVFILAIIIIITCIPLVFSKVYRKKVDKNKTKRTPLGEESIFKQITFGHMGGYKSSSFCPQNERSYVSGARIRLSTYLNQTSPTVSAIEFVCSDGIQPYVMADKVLLLQKNIGEWTEIKECPLGGFVTGITLYTQLVSFDMIAGENVKNVLRKNREADPTRFLDLFAVGRNSFISGITLNCTYDQEDVDLDWNDLSQQQPGGNPVLRHLWRNSITLGVSSGMGIRMFCIDNRIVAGISVTQEALLTYENGERWIPTDFAVKCRVITNPVKTCFPDLEWERINERDKTCKNVATGRDAITNKTDSSSDPANVTCRVEHFIGLSPNKDIENLNRILRAYQPANLEGFFTRMFLRAKLYSFLFHRDWLKKYKLTEDEYFNAVLMRPSSAYLKMARDAHIIDFTNVDFKEPEYSKLIRNQKDEPLKYEFNVKQLVGYCSIYKIYFPLFKSEFHTYFERKIDGVKSRIIFPMVADGSTILEDAIESRLGVKINLKSL